MNRLLLITVLLLLGTSAFSQNALSGKITDKKNNAIDGAIVYVPDLKIGGASHSDGSYTLNHLPKGNFLVEVRFLGYTLETKLIKIEGATTQDFSLDESSTETQEVVITGTSKAVTKDMTPAPIVEIDHEYLIQNNSTNIIDALSKVPGVSGITDGQSISKPVIRGLGYNRVVTVNDGIRQEGQQWGDEFGIEVDPNSVDRVEILKGPASLVYGSDAISGVVNLLPEKTLPEGRIEGNLNYNYQTNNGLHNIMASTAGNIKGFTWSARFTNIMAHAYQNKYDGYVFNSQFSNRAYDVTLGYHRKLGFTQLHFSYFELKTGIVEGLRDSATGKFVFHTSPNIATYQDLTSYTPYEINQVVQHYKLVWDNSIAVGKGNIIGRFAWQQNRRQEHNDPTIPDIANIHYLLNTINYDLRYNSPTWHGFDFTVGANGMYQFSQNKGTLLLIPEYNLFDIGAFVIANFTYKKLNISGGVRYDQRLFKANDNYVDAGGNQVSPTDSTAIHQFTAYSSNFGGISGSIGATYQLPKNFYLKLNLGHGFRAPNVAESGSNGVHDGTVVYEYGTSNLKPETSTQIDFALGINSKDVSAELSIFGNFISNYIFPKQLKSAVAGVGDSIVNNVPGYASAPAFRYTQGNATLWGGEVMLDIHPTAIPWFDLYAGFSIVNARLNNTPDSAKYLPFIPPAKLKAELTLRMKKLGNALSKPFIRFGVNYTFKQTQIYQQTQVYYALPAAEAQASLSPSMDYVLLNAAIGTDIQIQGRKMCTLIFSVDNILDNAYMDYMSRFKYYPLNTGSTPNRVGVFNMGRNFSFKVLVPLVFKK